MWCNRHLDARGTCLHSELQRHVGDRFPLGTGQKQWNVTQRQHSDFTRVYALTTAMSAAEALSGPYLAGIKYWEP